MMHVVVVMSLLGWIGDGGVFDVRRRVPHVVAHGRHRPWRDDCVEQERRDQKPVEEARIHDEARLRSVRESCNCGDERNLVIARPRDAMHVDRAFSQLI